MPEHESRHIAEEALYCRIYQIACANECGPSESAVKNAIFHEFRGRYKYGSKGAASPASVDVLILSRRAFSIAKKCAFGPMIFNAGKYSYCAMQTAPGLSGLEIALRKYDIIARHLSVRSHDPAETVKLEEINERIYERYLEKGGGLPEDEIRIVSAAIDRHFGNAVPPADVDAAYFEKEIIAKILKRMMAGEGFSLDDLVFVRGLYQESIRGRARSGDAVSAPAKTIRDIYLALGDREREGKSEKENSFTNGSIEKERCVLRHELDSRDGERLTDILARIGYFRPARFSSLAYATIDIVTANYCNPLRRQNPGKRCERILPQVRPARETITPGIRGEIDALIGREWGYLASVIKKVAEYEYLIGCGVRDSLAAATAAAVAKYIAPDAPSYAEVGRDMRWPEKQVREMIVNVNRLIQHEILRTRKDIPSGLAKYITVNRTRKAARP